MPALTDGARVYVCDLIDHVCAAIERLQHTHRSAVPDRSISFISPVQFLTHMLTECEPAVCLLVVLLQIMVTLSKLY